MPRGGGEVVDFVEDNQLELVAQGFGLGKGAGVGGHGQWLQLFLLAVPNPNRQVKSVFQ